MTIVFFDMDKLQIHLCTESEPLQTFDITDTSVLNFIDDTESKILYVKSGFYITREQLENIVTGKLDLTKTNVPKQVKKSQDLTNKQYLHPKFPGSIIIDDIPFKSARFPDGVIELNGKWDFLDIDDIGGMDAVYESRKTSTMLEKGHLEIVDNKYYQANRNKKKSLNSREQDSVLLPASVKAKNRAYGIEDDDENLVTSDDHEHAAMIESAQNRKAQQILQRNNVIEVVVE